MQAVAKNGFRYADRIFPIVLAAFEQAIGKNGLRTLLNTINRSHLLTLSFTVPSLQTFPFTNFSALFAGLEEIYGVKGAKVLAIQVGRSIFSGMLTNFVELSEWQIRRETGVLQSKQIHSALVTLAEFLSEISEQKCVVVESENEFIFSLQACPACWARTDQGQPSCAVISGFLMEALKLLSGVDQIRLHESKCIACGDTACEFLIQKPSTSVTQDRKPDAGVSG